MQKDKIKILIVDDERGLRIGTQRMLQGEGFNVDTAENGTEGSEKGTQGDYDIAIIDLKMPDISGIEVLKNIKAARPNTVCFIATAFPGYDTAQEAAKLGALNYIPKPFTPEELLHQIDQGIKQRSLYLEAERLKKEREERLLEVAHEKSRLNTIIGTISDGILVINKEGEVVYYNSSALKYLCIAELTVGEYVLDKLPDEIVDITEHYLKSEQVESKSLTTQIEMKPENELFIEASAAPVPHPDGSFAGVVLVIKNITGFKKIEIIKNQFVSMVAHELKAPVAAVLGFLRMILDENIPMSEEQMNDYLSRSTGRLDSLLALVNDLLDISRMETKTKQREIVDVDLKEQIESTVDFMELELKNKGIEVVDNLPDNLPVVEADKNEISRIFTNLLSNAVKYNQENGNIFLDADVTKNFVTVTVRDTGIGMKPEEQKKLFQEFFRAKNKKTKHIGGTGLGLNIVKRLVEAYNGNISAESKFGEGTAFRVSLPYKNSGVS